ncbi:hypothetical protein GV827_13060 [Sulfitobacter sp. JBTF-M27]|uniref:Uncharacterized protein n=2 Tax=Sulfitobacter sediminilitoris TaxID=2698830 RepID=A0A6P0CB19_9RHOB|nr:hypothetical protein [Sulfitobacter sediminilitoris]NEK23332.1 hypothetical protein [Sulfitobacter sediminilitoris]
MTAPEDQGTGILIGASSFVDASEALRLIGRLMTDLRPRLGGILVEDAETTAVCALPNQRVVTASGTLALAPTLSQMRTLMEADARAFRQSLARIAEGVGAPWTFEREMGDLIQQGLRTALSWDILVLAHRSINAVSGKVVFFTAPSSPPSRSDDLSQALAGTLSAERMVFTIDPSLDDEPDRETGNTRRFQNLGQALKGLGRVNAQAVVIDLSSGPIEHAQDLRRLIDAARCPVFVLGMSGANRVLAHSTQIPPSPQSEPGQQ